MLLTAFLSYNGSKFQESYTPPAAQIRVKCIVCRIKEYQEALDRKRKCRHPKKLHTAQKMSCQNLIWTTGWRTGHLGARIAQLP
jgi:hypothetical protein